jgi:hypothetical protein
MRYTFVSLGGKLSHEPHHWPPCAAGVERRHRFTPLW